MTYVASIPLAVVFIQQAGMGWTARTHLSIENILGGIVMVCVVWAPLTCVWLSWILLPLAALGAYIYAGMRRGVEADRNG